PYGKVTAGDFTSVVTITIAWQ
ncbi:fimbrial protein SthD, partial [Salmonella enterica subsp. enterica serovar Saintpaul]|nr:fimbrial protein SthD [Salmonella enterica subsp. enterica serovar Saintpaul]